MLQLTARVLGGGGGVAQHRTALVYTDRMAEVLN